MHHEIRMIITDLDGTLLQNDNTVSARAGEVFSRVKKAGILPVVATGRNESESAFACQKIGADRFIIAMNGLLVYDYEAGRPLRYTHMDGRVASRILGLLEDCGVFYQIYADNRTVCTKRSDRILEKSGIPVKYVDFFRERQRAVEDINAYLEESRIPVDKFFVSTLRTGVMEALRRRLSDLPEVLCFSPMPQYLEIVPRGIDKRLAMLELCGRLSISPRQVMAIGDSENDVELLEAAGVGVATGNAYECAKRAADYVAPPNTEDGAARAVEELILGGPRCCVRTTGPVPAADPGVSL